MGIRERLKTWMRSAIYAAFDFRELNRDEKYISTLTTKLNLPNGKTYEFNHYQSHNHHLIPGNLSDIHGVLNEFKTLYDHATIIEDYGLATFNKALLSLKTLWNSGLLISQTAFLTELAKNESSKSVQNIESLCWITRDRPESIRRSLESFIEGLSQTDYKHDYIVFDDSLPENHKKVRENIGKISDKYKSEIRLIGRVERKVFVDKLIQEMNGDVPKHVLEYGLNGLEDIDYRTGANRNTFLLYTAGKRTLLSDDDVFCKMTENGSTEELSITPDASYQHFSCDFFKGHDELNKNIHFDYTDPINLHQKLLGYTLRELSKKYISKIDLKRVTTEFVVDTLNSEKKVRITMMGVAGDSGAGSEISKIVVSGENLLRLISDQGNFRSRLLSRVVLQSHKSLSVGQPNFLLGMNLGFDSTELLPPFHPNFRNSDGIFASVLKKCFSNSLIGHLPYAISHIPPEDRQVDLSDLSSTNIRIPDILNLSINDFTNRTKSEEEGLRSLGSFLKDIAGRPDSDLDEYLRFARSIITSSNITKISKLYNEYKEVNSDWAEMLEYRMELLYKELQDSSSMINFKETEGLPHENQIITIRRVYKNFGELLFYWPQIYTSVCSNKDVLINDKNYFDT